MREQSKGDGESFDHRTVMDDVTGEGQMRIRRIERPFAAAKGNPRVCEVGQRGEKSGPRVDQ